jgi:hypothetical protein
MCTPKLHRFTEYVDIDAQNVEVSGDGKAIRTGADNSDSI